MTKRKRVSNANAKPRASKYHNKPVVIDGIRFASQAEGNYYRRLKERVWTPPEDDSVSDSTPPPDAITDLRLQVKYPLIVNGVNITSYIADFTYINADGKLVVVDVKGYRTREYTHKERLMLALYDITITVINAKDCCKR